MKKGYIKIQISDVWEIVNKPHRLFSDIAKEVEKLPVGNYEFLDFNKTEKEKIVNTLKNLRLK